MYTIALMLVTASGFIHSVWNLFAKQSTNKVVFLWFCQWAAILFFLPIALHEVTELPHAIPFVGWVVVSMSVLAHGVYVVLLAKTYTAGDLSKAYPIMRGTSPLLVPFLAVMTLGEHLSAVGWVGVTCIIAGILFIGGAQYGKLSDLGTNVVLLSFCVGLTITAYTVIDKLAVSYVPPVLLNEFSNLGNLTALSWGALHSQVVRREWRSHWKTILLGGIMAPLGYILFLKALQMAPVAQMAPMREIGTVFGVLLGVLVLKEPQGKRRLGAATLIVLGVFLLRDA